MQRINILLSKKILRDYALLFLMLGVGIPLGYRLVLGPSDYHILLLMVVVPLSFVITIASNHKLPLYLEYDDETIIAHYPFGKRAVVSRTHTIYKGYTKRNRMEICTVFSNTPFRTSYISSIDFDAPKDMRFALHIDRSTQIVIPQQDCPEAIRLFPLEMYVPVESVDWDVLTAASRPANRAKPPAKHIDLLPTFFEHLLCLAAGFIALIALLVFFLVSFHFPTFLLLVIGGSFWLAAVRRAYRSLRFCAKIQFDEHSITSTLFRKRQCTADLTQPVYFALFRGGEYGSEGIPYIVISNQWFNYCHIMEPRRSYLSIYDPNTQLVFPYNAETTAYCDFDSWHCVGGFAELNMKRSKD